MAYSYTAFTGNGSTTQYAVAFAYIRREHVAVTVAGVPATFTWVNNSLIQMDAAPANGAAVRVYRTTPIDAPLVDFADGATLVAADLDTNSRQSIYIQQELDDAQVDNLPNLIPNGNKGDITTSVGGTVWAINTGAVTEAKIGTGAVTEAKIGTGAVTSAKILDGTIVNADINASAGIVATKLSFTQSGTGATVRTVDSKLKDVVSVKDFGAVGDGTTDDTTAIQAAVNYCLSNNIGSLFFPFQRGERYKLTSTINITRGDFELLGTACNANTLTNTGYIFSPTSGAVLFNYGNNTSIGGAFTCKGLNFLGDAGVTQTAFKFSDSSNGPARAVTFRDCSFVQFENALLFDTPGTTIAPSFVDVQDCNFRGGNYAVRANDQVLGLRFVANQSEQGARIKGNISAWAIITNNLIEGQNDFLDISGTGSCSLVFADNYVEANNGNFLGAVGFSNAAGTLIKLGYMYNGGGSRLDNFYIELGTVFAESNLDTSQLVTLAPGGGLFSGSRGFASGYKVHLPSTASNNASSILAADDYVSSYSTADAYLGGNGAVTGLAPHGTISTISEFTTSAYGGWQSLTKAIAVGDAITISYLVRIKDSSSPGSSYVFIQVLDSTFSLDMSSANVEGNSSSEFINSNKWFLITTTALAPSAVSGLRFRIQPYPGLVGSASSFQVGGVAVKTFTPSGSRFVTKPIYPYV